MKFTTSAIALAATASTAVAQSYPASPLSIASGLLNLLTPQCQSTVLQLVNTSSPIGQCLDFAGLLPVLMTNDSIIEPIDDYLSTICSSAPCSNATLNETYTAIVAGCGTDLESIGIDNSTVATIFDYYPLAREVACLKTSMPYNETNATIPISNSTYNTTNGTFCATSLLTELSTYLGANLTNAYVDTTILGGNATAYNLVMNIPSSYLCDDCIYAALDLVDQQVDVLSINVSQNITLEQFIGGTCNASGYDQSYNGTLPITVFESAINSTYPYNITIGTTNSTSETSSPVTRDMSAIKRRWLGVW